MAISILSDNLITLSGLFDTISNVYVNTATVHATLYTGSSSITTLSLNYVPGSNGNYQGILPFAITENLTENSVYSVAVSADWAGNQLYVRQKNLGKIAEV